MYMVKYKNSVHIIFQAIKEKNKNTDFFVNVSNTSALIRAIEPYMIKPLSEQK